MLYRQTKVFTKFFLILHSLFFFSCISNVNKEFPPPAAPPEKVPTSPKSTVATPKKVHAPIFVGKKTFEFLPYTQGNWKIIRQQVEYQDGFSLSSISSIWILKKDFPVELITLDNFTPEDIDIASYSEGDKISLRGTDDFYPVKDFLTTETEENNFTLCNDDEFQMFARIYSNFKYTGINYNDRDYDKKPWFKFGNIVCAKIIR